MASSYAAALTLDLRGTINDGNATNFGTVAAVLKLAFPDLKLTDGNGSGKVNKIWVAKRTLAASSNDDFDLRNSSLLDVFGTALQFGSIKAVALVNTTTAAGVNLQLGAAASNAWEDWTNVAGSTILVGPNNGLALLTSLAGFACSGSNKNLRVRNTHGSTAADYQIAVFGSAS